MGPHHQYSHGPHAGGDGGHQGSHRHTIDVYVEAPIDVGGFIRYPELPDIIRVAAPVYVKVGISNAPDIYPAGRHLEAMLEDLSRERVRRARLALDLLERAGSEAIMSDPGAAGLAVPVVPTPPGPAPGRGRKGRRMDSR